MFQEFQKVRVFYGGDVVDDYGPWNYHQIDATNSYHSATISHQQLDICIISSETKSIHNFLSNRMRHSSLNYVNVFQMLDTFGKLCNLRVENYYIPEFQWNQFKLVKGR